MSIPPDAVPLGGASHPLPPVDAVPRPAPPHWTRTLLKLILAIVLFAVMADLLIGVLLRYVVVEITDYFDWPSISFFWVEEVGEFGLAWLIAIGAAVAIVEHTHFALAVIAHRLSPRSQDLVNRFNHVLIGGFGVLVAAQGVKISLLNAMLESPGLGLNLAWLYGSAVVGGTLTAIYGLGIALGLIRGAPAGAH